ncbi:MAG: winged helix-turn-helix domain-containing protein [Myxococcota bacterium]
MLALPFERVALEACDVDLVRGEVHPRAAPGAAPGEPRQLTTRERELLLHLVTHAGEVVPREALIAEVWGYSDAVVTRACDNAVARLRAKIEAQPGHPTHLLTVHGAGYRFVLQSAPAPAPSVEAPPPAAPQILLGDVAVDLERHRVTGPGGEQALSAQEVELVRCLWEAAGRVVDRDTLTRRVWGQGSGRALVNAVHRLRHKLEADPAAPRFLLTERSGGYRLEVPRPRCPPPRAACSAGSPRWPSCAPRSPAGAGCSSSGPAASAKTRLAREVAGEVRTFLGRPRRRAHGRGPRRRRGPRARPPPRRRRGPAGADRPGAGVPRPALLVLDNLEQLADAVGSRVAAWLAAAPDLRLLGTSRVRLGLDEEQAIEARPALRRRRRGSRRPGPRRVEPPASAARRRARAGRAARRPAARARARGGAPAHPRPRRDPGPARPPARPAGPPARRERPPPLAARRDRLDVGPARSGPRRGDRAAPPLPHGLLPRRRRGPPRRRRRRPPAGSPRPQPRRPARRRRPPLRHHRGRRRLRRRAGTPELARRWAAWVARLGAPEGVATLGFAGQARARAQRRAVDDLERAADQALAAGEVALAVRAALGAAWVRRHDGPFAPAVERLQAVLAAEPAPDDRARVQVALGHLLRLLDRPAEAHDAFRAAWETPEAPIALRAEAAAALGAALFDLARLEDARAINALAAEAFDEAGQPDRAAWCRGRVGLVAGVDGAGTLAAFTAAVEASRATGDVQCGGMCLVQVARFDFANGRPALARRRLDEAMALFRDNEHVQGQIDAGILQMVQQAQAGDHDAVEAAAEPVLALLARTGSQVDLAMAWVYLGTSRLLRGALEPAREAFAESRRHLSRTRAIPRTEGYLEVREAEWMLAMGEPGSAAGLLRDAIARFAGIGDRVNVAEAELALARVLVVAGDGAEALALADGAMAALAGREDVTIVLAHAQRGQARVATGDRAGAEADLAAAEAHADRLGLVLPRGEARLQIARLQRLLGGDCRA